MTKKDLIAQVKNEYEEGRSYLEPRKTRWTRQLVLMNNLQRGEQNVASTMLPSYFNRVFAGIHSNTPTVKFVPGNDAELYATESLNKMAVADAQEMNKPMLDYDWDWDTCFYGAGYLETLKWIKSRKLMQPEVINPMFFQYDPYFSEVQDWRYYSKWKLLNAHQLKRLIDDGVVDGIKKIGDIETGVDPYIWTWKIQAEQAKDVNPAATETMVPQSNIYQIFEHFTYVDGKKSVVWTNRSMSKVLRVDELDLKDDADHPGESLWPIVRKTIFREPHSSAAVSVPDLLEDKHRAQNVILNLAYIAAKDEVNPIYEYVPEKLKNAAMLYQRQINQHIPVTELGAIAPLKQKASLSSAVLALMNTLKQEGADVVGTAQPASIGSKKKSATQDAILQQIADMTQSLQSKLVQQAEMEFWGKWYQKLITNKEDGGFKMLALTDALGTTFEQIELDKIKTKYPPRVILMNLKEAEYKETLERREIAGQMALLQGSMSPGQFRMFLKQIYFPKFKTFDHSSIDLAFPKTIDEMVAESENESLAAGEWIEPKPTDDHETHLYIHMRGKKNAEMNTHILVHQYALAQAAAQAAQKPPDEAGEGIDENKGPKDASGGAGGDQKQPPGNGVGKKKPSSTTGAEAAVPSSTTKSAVQPT